MVGKRLYILFLFLTAGSLMAQDQAVHPEDSLDVMTQLWHALPSAEVSSVGLASGALDESEIPGSMQRISTKALHQMAYADPIRTLQSLAGLNLVEEDGFGLRPNIGMRGSGSDRSSRVTVMEDGVLMAPAPYAAPSAYYFPSMARMESVEVRKGGSQISSGPQTAGGAINLVSKRIPQEDFAGHMRLETGSFGNQQMHGFVGGRQGSWGYSVDWIRLASQGFKELDGGGSTGFDKEDLVFKLEHRPLDSKHAFRLKWAMSSERSNETYLGLSDGDFGQTPFRRYAASQNDLMAANHQHQILTHEFRPTSNWSMTTDAYMTHFARNWYKLDRMVDTSGTKWSLGDVLAEGGEMLGWLQGADTPDGAGLDMKANNRRYGSAGVQHRGMWGSQSKHRVSYGFRVHQDWMDRNEWRDRYAMQEGDMVLTMAGDSGTASNRLERAQAVAGYVRGALHWGRWTVTPGVRHEWMVLSREEFGEDLQRIERGDIRSHVVSAWLPGAGVHYQVVPHLWTAFVGVHRGFVPPGSNPDTQPEFSTHVEVGSRLSTPYVNGQLTLFYSEHDNLLGSDLTANGGTGEGDRFNGGASMARGLELEMVGDLLELTGTDALFEEGKHHFPVRMSYTFTQAQFTQSFESDFEPWGRVSSGDELPYVAPHQGSLSASWESRRWSVDVNLRAMGAMRTVAGHGDLIATESTDAMMVIDAGARWKSDDHVEWFVGATNVTDEIYVVARRPYGARPGMPRALRLGATVVF